MSVWESPAKLNLSLHVMPPRPDGYHPVDSVIQTIEWCDSLEIKLGDGDDSVTPDIEGNTLVKAIEGLRKVSDLPPLSVNVDKQIPMQAGLGGGSSNAAALLAEVADRFDLQRQAVMEVALAVGSDVPLFLSGGTVRVAGIGDQLEPMQPAADFAVAVAVPEFGLSTADVYRLWDELEGPTGETTPDESLPPSLRGAMPMRNDLLIAAVDLEPRLGDFMADLRDRWNTVVSLTGSGSGCFAYFPSLDEARSAAAEVPHEGARARGVAPRPVGVSKRN